ncbi:restriction endonuclease subunit S [Aliivibrio logei]|uniref:Restriction endonuclease subunit S n=1 Tax=Aliivibrio logei TaxID=688 RepID=A0A1B9P0N5_ALILO|nr:restriction endonuclease subunit S [Aliivibrio logei]OCH21918.1 restriction endonuclease subunit S [Aliivibrio logei]
MLINKKKIAPKLRFPGFQEEWEEKSLGQFMSFKNGINADKEQYGHGRKFINVLDIIADRPIYHDDIIGSVSVFDKEFEKNEVVFGDVLFQRSSETREDAGQSNIYLDKDKSATFGGFVIRGRPTAEFNPIYLDLLLKTSSSRKEITTKSGGSTRFNVGQGSLSSVKITITTNLEEQQKIADFLSVLGERISNLHRKHELLEVYKRGLMQNLFSQDIRFKQDDDSDFPAWNEEPLNKLAERRTVKNKDNLIARVLTNSAVQGVVNQQDYFDKNIANANNLEGYYVLEKGDYVYNPRISAHAPVGPINKNKIGRGVMSPLYSIFHFKSDNNEFYEQYFKTTLWHRYMCSVANYGARYDRMNISTADFMNMTLPCPHVDEQDKIVSCLTAFDKKIEAISLQVSKLESFKEGLLQKMFA